MEFARVVTTSVLERAEMLENVDNHSIRVQHSYLGAFALELHALTLDPPRHRTRSIAIIADANGGKSGIITRYLQNHPRVKDGDLTKIPAICIDMSDIVIVQDLIVRLLEEIIRIPINPLK